MALPDNPITRKETYLAKIAGQEVQIPDVPITREEAYLNEIARNGGGGGYVLPTATADRLGGVKIGSGINVEEDGTISASGGGTTDYDDLDNHPSINGVELSGNKTASDLGLQGELTFDNVPTDGSDNPVKSGGVYASDEAIRKWTTAEAKSVSGNPITITDGSARKAEGLSVECNPKQNLHGYDHPWAGGAGKNLLPMTVAGIKKENIGGTWSDNAYTLNGVTFTVQTDEDGNVMGIKSVGTASAYSILVLPATAIITGNYILTGSAPNGSGNTWNLRLGKGASDSFVTFDDGSGVSFTAENDVYKARLAIMEGANINGTWYPMIRLASVSDATFEPYSNECPIEGYTECVVEVEDEDETTQDTAIITFGQTVYGGSVDFKTGKVTVTHGIVDMGELTWSWYGGLSVFISDGIASAVKKPSTNYQVLDGLCEVFPVVAREGVSNNQLFVNIDGRIGVVTNMYESNPTTFTAAMSGKYICYELATPIQLTLTPAELELLKGYNYITTNGTTIALDYLPDSLFAEIKNYVDAKIPPAPSSDGTYVLTCTVTDGTPAYSWESAT